jgi:hypothetical protein
VRLAALAVEDPRALGGAGVLSGPGRLRRFHAHILASLSRRASP